MTILEVTNITKSYGKHKVLDQINFAMEKPEIIALVGPNGSGKTTFLNIIANILAADSGEVKVFGKSNRDPSIFFDYSYMIDNRVLYDHLNGWDHLKYVADTHRSKKEDLEQAIELLGIRNFLGKKISEYSLGMKQQLLFTMALVNDPEFLILDEPFNGLDPSTIIKVRKILLERRHRGKAVLLSSHNLSEVDLMTSHILFLKDGSLIEEDISKYRKGLYYIKVQDVEKAIPNIESYRPIVRGNELSIELGANELSKLLKTLLEVTQITNIRREEIGSEKRYEELYGV